MNTAGQQELWQQFNLAVDNPDPGGGILYAIRYAAEDLKAHQSRVIETLTENGASISALDEHLGIEMPGLNPEQRERALLMLEELSVVNEALEYHDAGLSCESISELSDRLKTTYFAMLTPGGERVAYNFVSSGIPQVVHDIQTAHAQNDVLSPPDVHEVEELQEFAARHSDTLGSHSIIVIG